MAVDLAEQPDSPRSWVVAFVGSVAMVFTFGTPLSYGIFRQPLAETFAIPVVSLSTVFSVMLFTFFIGSGVVGVFAARLSARWLLVACAAATALIAPSLYVTGSLAGLVVVFGVLGLALGTAFILVASIVPRWFEERRGAATGLIFVGNGLGLFVLPPVWQYAFSTVGPRRGFLLVMSVTAVAFAFAAVVCRRPRWTTQSAESTEELLEWVRRLSTSRTFHLLFVGMALGFGWYQLLAAYATDLFAARGLTEATASAAFGLIGGVSIVTRIGGGYLADRVGPRLAFLSSLGCAAAGILLFFGPQLPLVAGGILLTGLGLGGCATLYIPLLMQIYDPEMDTAIIGVFNVAAGVGSLAMPPLGAVAIANTDGYALAVLLTFVVTALSLCAMAAGTRSVQ